MHVEEAKNEAKSFAEKIEYPHRPCDARKTKENERQQGRKKKTKNWDAEHHISSTQILPPKHISFTHPKNAKQRKPCEDSLVIYQMETILHPEKKKRRKKE